MKKVSCDVLVIGGGPAGGVSAVTAKMNYPEKEILVIREFEKQLVPCAIPYIFGETLGSSDKNVASCGMATEMGISTLLGKVEDIDLEKKIAYSAENAISFDKLIFATGSQPFVHESLRHALSLEGVYTIPKNKTIIDKLKAYSDTKTEVVIVGSGFIGVEIAVEFASSGKNVTVIGGSKHILPNAFDSEIALEAEKIMLDAGVRYIGEDRVTEIIDNNGDKIVNAVKLKSGLVIDAEVVVLATG